MILDNDEHFSKDQDPIETKELGIVISVIDENPLKASFPIEVTDESKMTTLISFALKSVLFVSNFVINTEIIKFAVFVFL